MPARAPCILLWSGARRGGCAQRADGSWEPWVVSGDGLCGQPRPALSQRLSLETVASSWAGVRARDRWQEAHCRDQTERRPPEGGDRPSAQARPPSHSVPAVGARPPAVRHLLPLSQPLLPRGGWLCDRNPCFKCSTAAPPTRPISNPVGPGEGSGDHCGVRRRPAPAAKCAGERADLHAVP